MTLINGSFEEGADERGFAKGWYYQRQMEVVEGLSPSGTHYAQFENKVPGQYAHVMQGIAIDGRQVPTISFSVRIASENVIQGNGPNDIPVAALTFYNAQRKDLSTTYLGPIAGTTTWTQLTKPQVRVPNATREAIVRIGLFGATGKVNFDDVRINVYSKDDN